MYRMLLVASVSLLSIGSIAVVQATADEGEVAASGAADEQSLEEQFDAIESDYKAAMQEFQAAYTAATREARKMEDQAEARKAVQLIYQEKYPRPESYARRYLKLAEDNASDPIAVKSLGWVLQRARGAQEIDKACGLLVEHHVESDQLRPIVMSMTRAQPSENTEAFLRSVATKNPDDDTKGMAKYALAKYLANLSSVRTTLEQDNERAAMFKNLLGEQLVARLMDRSVKDFESEAEALLEDVAANHGDISYGRRTLADIVEGELFEIKYLAIGKVAPDIAGEDLDGVPFKLSDYRGKVVVIDFWGDW